MVRNFVERLLNLPFLLDEADGGASGGGGTGDGTSAAGNNGSTKPEGGDGTQSTNGNVKPGTGGNAPVEDPRIKGLIADLAKERKARQALEANHGTTAAELERERKRVRALSGLDNPTPEEADERLIRERLERLYPWMKELTPEDIAAIRESKTSMEEIRSATKHTWTAHGTKMLTQVVTGAQKALGGGQLSERQALRIQRAYVEEARENPEFLARHEAGDPSLVEEFIKEWLDDFYEPGRRAALQQEVQRRPRVPGGKDRSIVGANGEKPIDVKDDKAVEDVLVSGFRNRGGQFGRR